MMWISEEWLYKGGALLTAGLAVILTILSIALVLRMWRGDDDSRDNDDGKGAGASGGDENPDSAGGAESEVALSNERDATADTALVRQKDQESGS